MPGGGPQHASGGRRARPLIIVVMGVSGAGKTTVASALGHQLGWTFQEGDALHPPANIARMKAGIPLTDADRVPWLAAVAAWIDGRRATGTPGIITCSALRRAYRDVIVGGRPDVGLVHLHGSRQLLAARLATRQGHFMPASLLESQCDTLEEPGPDEQPLVLDAGHDSASLVAEVIRHFGLGDRR